MRFVIVTLALFAFASCDKVIEVKLPPYEPELVLEMYLEEGEPMRCLLIESLPYTDTAINKPVNDAVVIFSDGTRNDTMASMINQDKKSGRYFNYFNPKLLMADLDKIYTLTVTTKTKKVSAKTSFSQRKIMIDSTIVRESVNEADSFSVGLIISDPADRDNYYRFLIGKNINYFGADPTDFRVSDVSFNGKPFSFFSDPNFARNDTVTIKIYSLNKDHYEYLESIGNARRSNFNPFSQPSRIKSNVMGGLGIFTSILYSEKKVIIR